MNHALVSTEHITEHTTVAPGLEILIRVYDKGMAMYLTTKPENVKGSQVLKLTGSQIRALRKILNVAVEEDQS